MRAPVGALVNLPRYVSQKTGKVYASAKVMAIAEMDDEEKRQLAALLEEPETDEAERRVKRARRQARRQGLRLVVRGFVIHIVDPWTNTIVAERLFLHEVEAYLAEDH